MSKGVQDPRWSNFKGVTDVSLEILNTRLGQQGQPLITNLANLKARSNGGLFTQTKSFRSRQTIVGADTIKKFLTASGVVNISTLNFSSAINLADIARQAVNETKSIIKADESTSETGKSTGNYTTQRQEPIYSTACGESFDPVKCSTMAADLYPQQKVEEFMQAFQLHKPKGANYGRMCDILRAHWTRFMTDALVDVFSQSPLTLDVSTLHDMAVERGLHIANKSPQDIANDLIRFMVEKVLTLDAIDYGLGEASDQIVNSLMSGNLNLSKLTKKQKLAVIMMGSRLNKKLLNFVMVEDGDELDREFQSFQEGLANLRSAVKSLSGDQGVKVAAGLAHTIAEMEQKEEAEGDKVASDEVEAPFPTSERVGRENVRFVSELKFPKSKSTFKIIGRLFELTGYLTKVAKMDKKLHIFLPTDSVMEQVLGPILGGISVEELARLPPIHDLLSFFTIIGGLSLSQVIKSRKGKLVTHSQDTISCQLAEDSGIVTLSHPAIKNRTMLIQPNPKLHGNTLFYDTSRFVGGPYEAKLKAAVSSKPTSPKVKKSASPKVKKSASPVDVKLPKVSPVKSPEVELTPCEQFVTQFAKKTLMNLSEALYGQVGVLRSTDGDIEDLNDISTLRQIVVTSKSLKGEISNEVLHFILQLARALSNERRVNKIFNIQIDFRDPKKACRSLSGFAQGGVKATPAKPKSPVKPEVEVKSQDHPTLADALLNTNCNILFAIIQAHEGTPYQDALGDSDISDLNVFGVPDDIMEGILASLDLTLDFLQSDEDNAPEYRNAILSSLFVEGDDGSDEIEVDDGTLRAIPSNPQDVHTFGDDSHLYILHDFDIPEGVLEVMGQSGEDAGSVEEPAEDPVEDESDDGAWIAELPQKGCERIYAMYEHLPGKLPKNVGEFAAHFPDQPDRDRDTIRAIYAINLVDLYGGNVETLQDAITDEMIDYLRTFMLGYSQDPSVNAKKAFDCSKIGRIHLAGQSKKVANVKSKFEQTPMPAKPTSPKSPKKSASPVKPKAAVVSDIKTSPKKSASPIKSASPKLPKKSASPKSSPQSPKLSPLKEPTNPILKRLAENDETTTTLFWVIRTGFDDVLESGRVQTFVSPHNDAWEDMYTHFNVTKDEILKSDKSINMVRSILHYHASEENHDPADFMRDITDDDEIADNTITTMYKVNGQPVRIQYGNGGYGTLGNIWTYPEVEQNEVNLYVIDAVQLYKPKVGKYEGTAKVTQTKQFEKDAKALAVLSKPSKSVKPKLPKKSASPKSSPPSSDVKASKCEEDSAPMKTFLEVLNNGKFKIITSLLKRAPIFNDIKLLDLEEDFTLFAPSDQAFSSHIGMSIETAVEIYNEIPVDDNLINLLRHHLVIGGILKVADLRTMASQNLPIIMDDGGDEDIDLFEGNLYMRGDSDKRITKSIPITAGVVHTIEFLLSLPDSGLEPVEATSDDDVEPAEASDE